MIAPNKLEVRESEIEGRGVFSTADISEGEIIEECHFLPITMCDYKALENLKTIVHTFPLFSKDCVVVLGFGSIYNHSSEPTAYWETDEEDNLFRFIALSDISEGDEVLVDYKKPSAP